MSVLYPVQQSSNVPNFATGPFLYGFGISIASATTFTISPGGARSYNSNYVVSYPTTVVNQPENITVDISVLGKNGVYPLPISSAISVDTMLPVYIIGDSSGVNAHPETVAAVVATGDNFLPYGYDSYRLIGYVYVQQISGNILDALYTGNTQSRQLVLRDEIALLVGGAAVTYTAIPMPSVPVSATKVHLTIGYTPATLGDSVSFSYSPLSAQAPAIIIPTAAQLGTYQIELSPTVVNGVATIYYLCSAAANNVTVTLSGFDIDMP